MAAFNVDLPPRVPFQYAAHPAPYPLRHGDTLPYTKPVLPPLQSIDLHNRLPRILAFTPSIARVFSPTPCSNKLVARMISNPVILPCKEKAQWDWRWKV